MPARLIETETLALPMEGIPDTAFFIKDRQGRYTSVNPRLVQRCGAVSAEDLLGRTVRDIFPAPFGPAFFQQDQRVLLSGRPVRDQLEVGFFADGTRRWSITQKFPLRSGAGEVDGLIGVTRDLPTLEATALQYAQVAALLQDMQRRYAEPVGLAALAAAHGLSSQRFARACVRIFGLTPRQLLLLIRMEAAIARLSGSESDTVAQIALACGYSDQSAFTRQFRSVIGLTPSAFRRHARVHPAWVLFGAPFRSRPGGPGGGLT